MLGRNDMLDDWLLLYPPQVEHLWFQQKQVEASSRKRDCVLYGRMGIVTLKPLGADTEATSHSTITSSTPH